MDYNIANESGGAKGPSGAVQYTDGGGGFVGSSDVTIRNGFFGIGTATPGAKLEVSGNVYITSNLLVGSSNTLVVDTINQKVGIGTTTPTTQLEIVGANSSSPTATIITYAGSSTNFNIIKLKRANGTISAPTAVTANQTLARIQAEGYNGTDFSTQSSFIGFRAAENFTTIAEGGFIEFYTTLIGGTTVTERMRIMDNGNVGIGTATPNANALLDVTSTTKAFMPPRMTTTEKNLIPTPTAGMVVYDNTLNKLAVYTSSWETLSNIFYEELSFTPTILGSTTAGTATYTSSTGRATKIGRLVTFSLFLSYNTGTGTGNLRVGGLPYTIGYACTFTIYAELITNTALNYIVTSSTAGTTTIGIDQIPTGGGGATGVPYDAAGIITISGSYIV